MAHTPNQRFEGKIAVVTASTNGIGFAIANRLAQEGAKVIVSSRKQKNVDSAVAKLSAEGLRVTGLVCHVAKAEDRKRVFDEADKLGGLDILVSNAAVNPAKSRILDCSENQWDKIFEVNVKAAFFLTKEAVPLMRKRGGGRIVYISTVAAYHQAALLGAYSLSKTALLGLTKAVALNLANDNINVNCVAPGVIKTRFAEFITNTPEIRDAALSLIPMRRFGLPKDVSGVVAFLVSDDANYITGETICVSGGQASRL